MQISELLNIENNMHAVISSGGKQHTVTPQLILKVEKIEGEIGTQVEFENVLLVQDSKDKVTVGSPYVKGAKVVGEIVKQARDKKVIVFKKKRRHNYRRKNGHRQYSTYVLIKEIIA